MKRAWRVGGFKLYMKSVGCKTCQESGGGGGGCRTYECGVKTWTVRGRSVNVHGGCRWGCKTYMVRECKHAWGVKRARKVVVRCVCERGC